MLDEQARELTRQGLQRDLINFLDNYMIAYDRYYDEKTSENEKQEISRLRELAYGLMGIFAIFEFYTTEGRVHVDYALEKINETKDYIDNFKTYYELWRQETGDVEANLAEEQEAEENEEN